MRSLKYSFVALALLLSVSLTALAQTSATATVSGTITDANGAVLAGADVEMTDTATNQSQKLATNSEGRYLFPTVLPGVYKLAVTAKGFRQAVVTALKVDVAKAYEVNLTLEVGNVGEIVEVTAGVAAELQRNDSTVGAVIGGEQLLRLPTINRSAAAVLAQQPMVQPIRGMGVLGGGQVAGARSDQSTFNLDGADATDLVAGTSGYTAGAIDWVGPTPMIPVPAESVEELRVGTTNPNATFGRSAGGQVNMVTKRGTNAIHGSAYWYHQNDALNAAGWTNKRTLAQNVTDPKLRHKIQEPELKDNRFGASLGGPIWKDRTFLFGHYEGRRFPRSANILRFVPSQQLRQGILRFRDAAGNVVSYDARSFDPRGRGISPVMRDFWNKFPDPNDLSVGDGLNNVGFRATADNTLRMDFGVARLDHIVTEKWRLDATYRYSTQNVADPTQVDIIGLTPGSARGQATTLSATPVEPRFVSAKLTGQFRPTLINEFTFGYARNWWAYKRQRPIPQLSGTTGALLAALGTLDQGIEVDTQRARSRIWRDHVWQFGDNLTWVKRDHTLQFGGTWRRMPVFHERDDKVVGSLSSLVYELNAQTSTGVPASSRPPTCGGGVTTNCIQSGDVGRYNDLFASALGIVDKAGILIARDGDLNPLPLGTPLTIDGLFHAVEFYGNDVWRIRPSLTVNAGLTYSVQTPPTDKNGKQTVIIDQATKKPVTIREYLAQRLQAGQAGQVFNPNLAYAPIRDAAIDRIYQTDWNNAGPRISAAWSPSFKDGFLGTLLGDNKSVFRGGYSLTFDRANGVAIIMIPILGVGFAQTITCLGPRTNGQCLPGSDPSNAFRIGVDGSTVPLPPVPPRSQALVPTSPFGETLSFSIDSELKIGKSHSLDLTIQRELPGNMLIEVGYAGRLGRELMQNFQLSTVPIFMKDSASGQTFAQAFDALATQLRAGVLPGAVTPQPWFENQLKGAALCGTGSCTAALAAARSAPIQQGQVNNLFTLINLSRPGGPIINTQVLDYQVRGSGGLSNYHSAFVSLTKRMSRGLTFTVNYTLSRTLDQYGLNQEFIGVMSNSYDLNADYGPALWDRTHVLNANWYYDLPFGQGKRLSSGSSVVDKIIGGWYTSGIFVANSGLPLTINQHPQAFGGDPLNFSLTAGAIPIGKPDFSNSVHSTPGVGTVGTNADPARRGSGLNYFGNPEQAFRSFRHILISQDTRHGRGVLRGFPRWNMDLSIGKKTNITEKVKTVFSFDMINAFNRIEFADAVPSILNPAAFGVITDQFAGPRAIQVGLRFEF